MVAFAIPAIAKSLIGALAKNDPLHQKAKTSAQEFEAIFLAQFMNISAEGLGDGLQEMGFGGGSSEEQWRSLMNEYAAKSIAKSGGIGLSDAIMREVLRAQGA